MKRRWIDAPLAPCGKIAHASRADAEAQLADLARSGRARATHKMESYMCMTCGFWHTGHRPGSRYRPKYKRVNRRRSA